MRNEIINKLMKSWKKRLAAGMLIASIVIALQVKSQINFCENYSGDCLPISQFTLILLKDFWWLWLLIIFAPLLIAFLAYELKVKIIKSKNEFKLKK